MNVLVIEDEPILLELMKVVLSEAGHKVFMAEKILPAFEILRHGNIDLILMDIGLPGLDGISFTRKLKKYPEFQAIPVIAVTGTPKEFLEEDALQAGCNAYLQKPFKTNELLRLISSIGPRRAKREKREQ